ncbi:GFA family protein [Luteimonas sp. SJ-92]|uniref:GFA family protein n=1 Tax=Luteimonas salinisoli TaxID=2752307 RepID=A0A853JDQ3_9GAMM|nr:GFA family protein [Luteimonas salinisoli]NZA27446.1 GFA family protein [Luteimonas salinisoli]
MVRTATCRCGRLQLACHGDPVRISVCHCLACQRRTGSAFGTQARFPRERVEFGGGAPVEYVCEADSGNRIVQRFCGACGSTLWYTLADAPDVIAVPVGAFADPGFPAPWISVWERRRHPWVAFADEAALEHVD